MFESLPQIDAPFGLIVAAFVGFYALVWLLRRLFSGPRKPRDMRDPKVQLDAVKRVGFEPVALMNKGEYRVLRQLDAIVARMGGEFRVMAQPNLGEFLRPDPDAPKVRRIEGHGATNSKRVDFLIIDSAGYGVLAVEVQGSGHYLGSTAHLRDAVKREALRKAGIALMEITPGMTPGEIAAEATSKLQAYRAA